MNRTSFVIALGLMLAACGPKAGSTTGATHAASDGAVQPGHGWTRSAPGQWLYSVDGDVAADMTLTASGTGQGMELITPPAGAKQATLSQLTVAYTSSGACTWTIYSDVNGAPGAVLATIPVSVTDADVAAVGEAPKWTTHAVTGVTVSAPVWAVFTVATAGQPGVAARKDAATADVTLQYRDTPDEAGQPVGHLPYVRATLTAVE